MSARVVTSDLCTRRRARCRYDDGAALEEERGGGGVVQVGHLQHGRVSIRRHLAQQPASPMFISLNVFLEFCVW